MRFTLAIGVWIISAYWSNWSRKFSSFLRVWSNFKSLVALTLVAFLRFFKNCFRLVLCECNSNTNFPRPTLSNLLFTTSSAAIFSLTKRTVFPSAISSAIKFTIVCDLPVPGGPSTTKLWPAFTFSITAICDESASKTWYIVL